MTTSDLRPLEHPFLNRLRDEGMADDTVAAYATDLHRFLENDADISLETVNDWLDAEQSTFSDSLVFRRRSALRRFFSFVADHGYPNLRDLTAANPTMIRRPRRSSEHLTEEEVAVAMAMPFLRKYPFVHRDAGLIRLVYEAGLTSSEAARLQVSDLDIPAGYVNVDPVRRQNPGRSARFSRKTGDVLTTYLLHERTGRPVSAGHDRLWVNASGWPLVRGDIWAILRMHGDAMGLTVNTRVLRTSRAMHLLRAGAPRSEVAAMLGLDRPTIRAFKKEAAGAR